MSVLKRKGSEVIIRYLGEKLSEQTGLKQIAATGFIRLAIKDEYGLSEDMDVPKLRKVINSSLKNRLDRIDVPNLNSLIPSLDKVLMMNQSLLVMASF